MGQWGLCGYEIWGGGGGIDKSVGVCTGWLDDGGCAEAIRGRGGGRLVIGWTVEVLLRRGTGDKPPSSQGGDDTTVCDVESVSF